MTNGTAARPSAPVALEWDQWRESLHDAAGEEGFAEWLGPTHAAIFRERKPVLLVSFENFDTVQDDPAPGNSLLTPLVDALGWSHMSLISLGDTWFRDRHVIGFFDRLVDDGFFEDFDQVIFYGAGAAGYAACTFSVTSPGARVLALQPQATLDPRTTEWDRRFTHMRRTDFTSRYGYAPYMIEGAREAWVFYNPAVIQDAMHASLFHRTNVNLVRTRHLGPDLQRSLMRMNVLYRLLALLSAGRLTDRTVAEVMRKRRGDRGYLLALMLELEERKRFGLLKMFCEAVLPEINARPFRRALKRANQALDSHETRPENMNA